MIKVFVLWSCLLAILAISAGSGSDFASKDMPGSQQQTELPAATVPTPALTPGFGRIPLYFVPNHGQIDNPVSFYIQGTDKTIYFAPDGVTFALGYPNKPKDEKEVRKLFQRPLYEDEKPPDKDKSLKRWTVKLDFVGARKEVNPEGMDKTGAVISHFKGKPEEWKAGLPSYSKILYRDLWPGIDLVYMGGVDRLKYEFIVHPGADPAQIRLAYRGTERVEVTEEGRLRVTTPAGVFEDDIPVAYQEVRGERKTVPLAYALDDPTKGLGPEVASDGKKSLEMAPEDRVCTYGFDVGEYDRNATLVLDPAVLVYCGYIGGSGEDVAFSIALDASRNVYITGYTYSSKSTFPEDVGPDLTQNGDMDAFVAKVNSSGTALIYCGYIGGSGVDICGGIAVDAMGNAYVAGSTQSLEATFPVRVGPDLTYNGGDSFVARVNSSGTGLVYCGYVGPTGFDFPNSWHADIAVDSAGYAYVIGSTSYHESSFPVKVGPDLTYNGGDYDAYVAKVNPSGSDLIYCGYIGGSGTDQGGDIAVDDSGNVYIGGETQSTESTFPVKVGPDLTFNGGGGGPPSDAFVAKISPSGNDLVYCGYVGGSDNEIMPFIAVDNSGNAYLTGQTLSTESTFPVKVGPDLTYNGGDLYTGGEAYVAKVSSSGDEFVYCGYIGSPNGENGSGIAVDRQGNAFIVGTTDATEASFPVKVGPDLTYNGGDSDAFVAKVNRFGTDLVYCGYIGGSDHEGAGWAGGGTIAVDNSGNAYITGDSSSSESTFPVLIGPDLTYNGTQDVFVAKVSPSGPGFVLSASPQSQTVTAGQSASHTISVTPDGGSFNSSVSFSCSGLPSKCTATISPESVTPGANAVTTTLTLATQATSAAGAMFGPIRIAPSALGLFLIILIFSLWFSLRNSAQAKPRRRWLTVGALVCLIVLLASCGTKGDGNGNGDGDNQPYTGTPKGTHYITVKGQSGSLTASATVTLVVN